MGGGGGRGRRGVGGGPSWRGYRGGGEVLLYRTEGVGGGGGCEVK
jgi:hypothetical protein